MSDKKGYYEDFKTPPIRMSFPTLFEAKPGPGGKDPAYSTVAFLPKEKTEDVKFVISKLVNFANTAYNQKFTEKDIVWKHGIMHIGKYPTIFKDSALVRKDVDGEEAEPYEKKDPNSKGCFYFLSKSDKRPGIIDKKGKVVFADAEIDRMTEADRIEKQVSDLREKDVYGGRWAKLYLTIASYEVKKGKPGITMYLKHVLLLEDDEKFGGGVTDPREAFADEKFEGNDTPLSDEADAAIKDAVGVQSIRQ